LAIIAGKKCVTQKFLLFFLLHFKKKRHRGLHCPGPTSLLEYHSDCTGPLAKRGGAAGTWGLRDLFEACLLGEPQQA
jgi:hypothetical protein